MTVGSSLDNLFEEDGILEEITEIALNRVNNFLSLEETLHVDRAVLQSSGNVFADLGLPNADEMLAKAQVTTKIYKSSRANNLSNLDLGVQLDISEERVIDLLHGRLSLFSLEELNNYYTKLNVNQDS